MHKTEKQLRSLGKQHYPQQFEEKRIFVNHAFVTEIFKTQMIDVNEDKRNAFIEGIKLGLQLSNNKNNNNEHSKSATKTEQ